MKKVIALVLSLCVMLSLASPVFAAATGWDSGNPQDSGDINIAAADGNDVELQGNIVPTILSVVMPSYIPFDLSLSLATENKVVSPLISVVNNSPTAVTVYVDNTKIDLSSLPGTGWNTSRYTYGNTISIGIVDSYTSPSTLDGVKWLADGKQHTELTTVSHYGNKRLFVAGTLGSNVPQNKSFSVIATLVARQA